MTNCMSSAMMCGDPEKPDLVLATNGGSDLIYLPSEDRKLAQRTAKALLEQDYASGIFVRGRSRMPTRLLAGSAARSVRISARVLRR